MVNAGLFDSSFPGENSATLAEGNHGTSPANVHWVRDQVLPVTFYTDMRLVEAVNHPSNITKVAWLIEPYSISYTHYERAMALQETFDYILTFDRTYLREGTQWKYYSLGGSWIVDSEWTDDPRNKIKSISLIGTDKNKTRGHGMRHKIAELSRLFPIDVMGRGYRTIPSKIEALRPYYYSIVVENERIPGYFTEKLIDCISQATLPIYWGCPDIENYFDTEGMITFDTVEELIEIMVKLKVNEWSNRYPAMKRNMNIALGYVCAEDWIYFNLPEVFEEKK